MTFKLVRMADGKLEDGTWFHRDLFRASDGGSLELFFAKFGSPSAAAAQLRTVTKNAARLIEQGPTKDKEGNTVGERVLAVFTTNEPHKTIAKVVWTDGPAYGELSSASLLDVLEAERAPDFNPQKTPKQP